MTAESTVNMAVLHSSATQSGSATWLWPSLDLLLSNTNHKSSVQPMINELKHEWILSTHCSNDRTCILNKWQWKKQSAKPLVFHLQSYAQVIRKMEEYSGTSHNGPSVKRTPPRSGQQTLIVYHAVQADTETTPTSVIKKYYLAREVLFFAESSLMHSFFQCRLSDQRAHTWHF